MADQVKVLDILIRTLAEGNGGELTIRQQRELKKALEEVQAGGDLTMRQFRLLEEAATKMGGEAAAAFGKVKAAMPQSSRPGYVQASDVSWYNAPIGPQLPPPVAPPPAPPRPVYQPSGNSAAPSTGDDVLEKYATQSEQARKKLQEGGYAIGPELEKAVELSAEELHVAQQMEQLLQARIIKLKLTKQEYSEELALLERIRASIAATPAREAQDHKEAIGPGLSGAPGAKELKEFTREQENAFTSAHSLKDALKGLALEFPAVAQVIRAVISPIGGAVAAAGAAVFKLVEYVNVVDEMVARAREFENVGDRIDPMRAIRTNIQTDRDAFTRSFNDIASSVNTINAALEEMNRLLLLQQRLADKLDDAELDKNIAAIEEKRAKGLISGSQANQQIIEAQRAARASKENRELETIKQQQVLQEMAAANAATAAQQAKAKAEGMDAPIAAQTKRVAKDREEQSKVDKSESLVPDMEKAKTLAQEFQSSGRPDILKTLQAYFQKWKISGDDVGIDWEPLTRPLISDAQRIAAAKKIEEQIQDRINQITKTREAAAAVVAQEEKRLAELKAAQAKAQEDATRNEQTRVAAEAKAKELAKQYEAEAAAKALRDAARREADRSRDAAAKTQEERAAKVTADEAEIAKLRAKRAGLPTGQMDPAIERRIAELENDINTNRNFDPSQKARVEAENAARSAETERRIREWIEQQFRNDNRGRGLGANAPVDVNIDPSQVGTAVASNNRQVIDITHQILSAVKGAAAQQDRAIAALKSDLRDLESRFNTSRAA